MNIQIILELSEQGGYTALVPALLGCISEGDSKKEAIKNVQEALLLYLEPIEADHRFTPEAEYFNIAL